MGVITAFRRDVTLNPSHSIHAADTLWDKVNSKQYNKPLITAFFYKVSLCYTTFLSTGRRPRLLTIVFGVCSASCDCQEWLIEYHLCSRNKSSVPLLRLLSCSYPYDLQFPIKGLSGRAREANMSPCLARCLPPLTISISRGKGLEILPWISR